jgi:hypothetical protein
MPIDRIGEYRLSHAPKLGKNDSNSPCSGRGAVCYTAPLTPFVSALRHLLDFEGLILQARS